MKIPPGGIAPPPSRPANFWQEIRHPFFWLSEEDLPRLRRNAELPFWKPRFAAWREELGGLAHLPLSTPVVDFHLGSNKAALKAALCYVVDGDEHHGRLIGTFLSAVVNYYRRSPDTILEDGLQYKIGSYGPGTIAAMPGFLSETAPASQ